MALAYLDPGSSSAILGAVAAGVGGAAVAGKAALSRFRRKKKDPEPVDAVDAEADGVEDGAGDDSGSEPSELVDDTEPAQS